MSGNRRNVCRGHCFALHPRSSLLDVFHPLSVVLLDFQALTDSYSSLGVTAAILCGAS